MRTATVCLTLALAVCAAPAQESRPASKPEPKKVAAARAMLQLWAGGQYEAFVQRGDATMQKAFDAKKSQAAWETAQFQYGKYQKELGFEEIPAGDYTAVRFTLRFERAVLKIRFVLDREDRLTGLWFDDVQMDAAKKLPPYVREGSFREEALTLKCDKFELPAILTLPVGSAASQAGGEKFPAVIFVHGSGAHDADETIGPNKPFRDLALGLASRGVASLRYEKRTKKYPTAIKPEEMTFEWETIDDAVAAAALLRGRPEIDPRRVFVVGHSLGAIAAPFIVQRDGKLAGAVQIAATARPLYDVVEDQVEYICSADGVVSEEEKKQLASIKQATAAMRAGKFNDVKEPLLGAPTRYWHDIFKHDNVAAAAELTLPLLLIHGERDYQVSKKDYDLWVAKLKNHKNATIRLFDKLNHLMIAGEGPSTPAEYAQAGHVDERVVAEIAGWIKEVGGRK